MSERDAFADGREQGWRDKERECERLKVALSACVKAIREVQLSINDAESHHLLKVPLLAHAEIIAAIGGGVR